MKRTRLNSISAKRRNVIKERREVVKQMFEDRGPVCELQTPTCAGMADAAHELVGRAQGGSLVDVRNMLLACNPCNGWVEDNPRMARLLGLKVPRWESVDGIGGRIPRSAA